MRRPMNRTVGDKTHESARYSSFLTVERPSRKGFDLLGWIFIRQALEGRLRLFTELPRRFILGNPVSGIPSSRKPSFRHSAFSETHMQPGGASGSRELCRRLRRPLITRRWHLLTWPRRPLRHVSCLWWGLRRGPPL